MYNKYVCVHTGRRVVKCTHRNECALCARIRSFAKSVLGFYVRVHTQLVRNSSRLIRYFIKLEFVDKYI